MAGQIWTWLITCACAHAVLGEIPYKHLAGGPDEFLPPAEPSLATIDSHIRLLPSFVLDSGNDLKSEDQTFLVDSPDFTFVVLCSSQEHLDHVELAFTSPSGQTRTPTVKSGGPFGIGGRTYPSLGLFFDDVQHGVWTVRIVVKRTAAIQDDIVNAFSFVTFSDGESPVSVRVSANNLNTLVGEKVQLSAVINDPTIRRHANGTLLCERVEADAPQKVELLVKHPNGKTSVEQMHSSVQSHDGTPVFSAGLGFEEAGSYQAEVVVMGTRCDGRSYERSAWYWMSAVEKTATLTGRAVVTESTADYHRDLMAEQVTVNLLLEKPPKGFGAPPANPTYRVYAEIYSGDKNKLDFTERVAWIGGLSDLSDVESSAALSLHLDTTWLWGYSGPFFLRNVRVEELESYSTVTSVDVMDLPLEEDTVLRLSKMERVKVITKAMREGYHVGRPALNKTSSSSAEGTLLLVHGYCAPDSPYTDADFTDYRVFQDYRQNRKISDFARLVAEFGADLKSFGAVGHSQGGLALLDMYTFLATGLDKATGDRRIQTLATPWRGSPLSGLLAIIGDLLGIGCGDNKDLSYDGAAKWLAGIPADKRAEVYFYTGQYSTGHLINYCILAANAVLSWPNDGMIEQSHSLLDGGHNMGHTKGQCHSVDMRDPPIAKNNERNKLLNSLAAR